MSVILITALFAGGGLGGTRKGGPDVNTKFSGREGRDDEIGFGGRDR